MDQPSWASLAPPSVHPVAIASLNWPGSQYDDYIAQHDDGGGGTTCRISLIHAVRQTDAGDVYDFLAPPESSMLFLHDQPCPQDSVLRPPLQAEKVQLQFELSLAAEHAIPLGGGGNQRGMA
ncbi:hypothetical protein G3M48_005774 [Beauveria asiatica]|uniref:Uncharacterized protein n=1 Tax=Beauveria asiatica TaxID=1069075 RepID=A0AAW0RR05_9HYPO